ncbi:MAG: serine protease, partial [Akkermansiaceae bacterium]|nr:serine protease [Akkermansiaceae bacterium]
ACGNSGGGGTVGHERGKVLGVGPESIEIDATVIQGNSGGPVIDAVTHAALGVVTHLTAARTDLWAKETRFAGVRRFGCRLDRTWKWKKMPIDAFLQEGKLAKKIALTNDLMAAALQPSQWESQTFIQNRDDALARDILALASWIEEQKQGGTKFSEVDRTKRLRSILQGAMFRSRAQTAELDYSGYAWFHRETLRQALEERKELDKAYLENIASLH